MFSTDSLSETLTSFSYLRKISSCLFICATFFPGTFGSKPGIQILIAGSTHIRQIFSITTAFTFLFLLGHHSLGQIVAVLLTQNAANLSVLPEEAHAAGLWLFSIVSDSVDQNGLVSRFFLITISSKDFDTLPGKSGNDKSPVMRISHRRAYVRYLYSVFFGSDFVLKCCLKARILHASCINTSEILTQGCAFRYQKYLSLNF